VIDVPEVTAVRITMLGGLGALALLILTEVVSHGSRSVELATLEMTRGRYAQRFWFGGVVLGLLVPMVLTAVALSADGAASGLSAVAGLSALVGLFAYEDAYVRAGQSVPLS
jgi:formate-dependent nitrite reductase membrane component NrfD